MDVAQGISVADTWGMHSGGWWILGAVMMMVMMGGMMWMMMRGMGSKRSSTRSEIPRPTENPHPTESPIEVLERRFAEGEVSVEEYRERREILAHETGAQNGRHEDEALTAAGPSERRR